MAVGDLQRGVAVALGGLHLDDAGRLDAEHGDGNDLVVHPHLAHGDFLANDRFQCHIGSLFGQTRLPGHRSYTQMLRRPNGRRSTGFSSCCEVPPSTHFWGRTQTSVGGTPAGVHEDLTLSDLAAPANPLSSQIHLTEALRTRYVRQTMFNFYAGAAINERGFGMPALKRILIGKPISSEEEAHQRIRKLVALPVFASDAISSTAYATDEILVVLLLQAGIGATAFNLLTPIAIVVCVLLVIVVMSYRQTIHAYPSGGGAYIVSRENLGETPVAGRRGIAPGRLHPDGGGQRRRRSAGHPHGNWFSTPSGPCRSVWRASS